LKLGATLDTESMVVSKSHIYLLKKKISIKKKTMIISLHSE